MANVDRPNGFRPVMYLNGAPWTGQARAYISPTDNLFVGDLVEAETTGSALGYSTVGRAEANDTIIGAVVGWDPDPSALDRKYHVASTTLKVYVADDPNLLFEAQADDNNITWDELQGNVNFVVAAGDTVSGVSNMEIDGDTVNTTNTLPLKLMQVVMRPDNEFGGTGAGVSFTRFLVKLNTSQYVTTTGTTGLA